jgi:hypothetical protein
VIMNMLVNLLVGHTKFSTHFTHREHRVLNLAPVYIPLEVPVVSEVRL